MLRVLETHNVEGSNAYDKTEAHKIWKVGFVFRDNLLRIKMTLKNSLQ